MPKCSWCGESVSKLVEFPLPDEDYVEVCTRCFLKEREKNSERYSEPRLKTTERSYARV